MMASAMPNSKKIDPKAAKKIVTQLTTLNAATTKQLTQVEKLSGQLEDDLSEMGELESLRLQMMMDRVSKMMTTLSNLLKKMQDTQEAITQNLK